MEPLKEMFNRKYYVQLSNELSKVHALFKKEQFLDEVTIDLTALSLNERMRRTSVVLKKHLPSNYSKAIDILKKTIPNTPRGYTNLVFPDFVGLYGHDDVELSMEALKYFTGFGSSEFAVREFLKRDFSRTIKVMHGWSEDPDHHVRRLSSEGSRPRLPWSFKLDAVIRDPQLTRPILENLRADKELYVRKSVANHLNDISKENADYMVKLVNAWDKSNPHTYWIIKHASRTLIKKGNADSLAVFDYEKHPKLKVGKIEIGQKKIRLGQYLDFQFELISERPKDQKLVIDFVIHYRKKNGELSPKVFKLKELLLESRQRVLVSKKLLFKDFTTRKHFPGKHVLTIQINGKAMGTESFYLSL